ncbi:DUF3500 domain-containing protein [Nakamurella multipartita]|uniref:DUF3500 domain-containing protein n=1 Tax=Nakamurella multipartita (strain ATCC 700099 / DSM 44233 / CIP 104796 / JCM 9543 / NBRC 105858 / Y-104) TaxID=479431 RepID=C8XKE5_NAKMY|nr:DUF3500 domain-containing protein [Nakamurella multipartita]ACV78707.1 hypothetical protein Namu_2331 [Nakamurella multipartita DSM 44233]
MNLSEPAAADAARREVATAMARAAQAWVDSLDLRQRARGLGHPPANEATDAERRRWFYTPTDHGGLTVHQQRPDQHRAAMRLISTGLSTPAYVTVATIMGLENVLDQIEGFTAKFDRIRGRDPGLYYLRVFGEPGGSAPWGWRFGGHHVSLNNLIVDGALVAATPLFLGADPAASPLLGGAVNRPLARVEDLGRDLVRSLPSELARRAILLDKAPSDFVTANRTTVADGDQVIPLAGVWRDEAFPDPVEQAKLQALSDRIDRNAGLDAHDHRVVAYTTRAKGVAAAEFDAEQRELLRRLLATYFGRVPDALSPASRYLDDAVLDQVSFAWAGSTQAGQPHYYRLQGPRLLIEWDNTQRGANHAHSVWRDPSADFGLDVLARHRAEHRH